MINLIEKNTNAVQSPLLLSQDSYIVQETGSLLNSYFPQLQKKGL